MRVLVTAAVASLLAGPVAAGPGTAAAGPAQPVVVRDVTGDANGVNGQGTGTGPGNLVTAPASLPAHDIVSARIASTGKVRTVKGRKRFVPDGVTVSLELAAAPANGVYRVFGRSALCDTVMLQFATGVVGDDGYLRHTCTDTGAPPPEFFDVPVPTTVSGRTVTWTLKLGALPRQLPVGTLIEGLSAETLGDGYLVTAPVVDDVLSPATYRIGD